MSTYEPTQTTAPTYSPTQTPPARRAPRNPWKIVTAVTIAVMLVAVGILTTVAFQQSDKADAARDKTAKVTKQRDEARTDLAGTQSTLVDTKADLAEAQDDADLYSSWVDDCTVAMKAARHMTDSVWPLFKALDADIFTATVKLREANEDIKAANRVIQNNGFGSIWELYDNCDLADSI